MEDQMTFTVAKPSRRKAYLKWQNTTKRDDTHHADLMAAHPDWIRPNQPLIDKVLDRQGQIIEKHRYITPQRTDNPEWQVILGKSICGRYIYDLFVCGGIYWIQETDTLLCSSRVSLNYGSGELAKKAYLNKNISW